MRTDVSYVAIGLALLAIVNCSRPSASTPSPSISASPQNRPQLVAPAPGEVVPDFAQPLTLVADPGPGAAAARYHFEVAEDSSFAAPIASVTVQSAATGLVEATLQRLPSGRAYFWRVVRVDESAVVASRATSFTVGPSLSGVYRMTIQAPSSACGSRFGSGIAIQADLSSEQGRVVLARSWENRHNAPVFVVNMGRVGRTLSGTMDSRRTEVEAPTGYVLDGMARVEGEVGADGTLRGTFPYFGLFLSSGLAGVPGETCDGDLRWSMVRQSP